MPVSETSPSLFYIVLPVRGFGCIGVAFLESKFDLDLQHAMLLVPVAYAMSGIAFYGAEAVMKNDTALNQAQ